MKSRAEIMAVAAGIAGLLSCANAQADPSSVTKWAACYLEASGGVGTSIALLAFEPFPVTQEQVGKVESGIGYEFDREVGVGTVVTNYKPFSPLDDRCTIFSDEEGARARYLARTVNRDYAIHKSIAWKPAWVSATPLQTNKAETKTSAEAAPADGTEVSTASPPLKKPKYVEVTGPDGITIRLTPEVAARNEAAANEYKRKMQEHAETVARIEAEKQAVAAKRAEVLAKAAEEKREYDRRLAEHASQVAAQKAAVANREAGKGQPKGVVEVVSRLTGPYRKTREEALATLMSVSKSYPDIFDIKCERMAGNYYEEPWTCWGSYRETKTRSSVSKQ